MLVLIGVSPLGKKPPLPGTGMILSLQLQCGFMTSVQGWVWYVLITFFYEILMDNLTEYKWFWELTYDYKSVPKITYKFSWWSVAADVYMYDRAQTSAYILMRCVK